MSLPSGPWDTGARPDRDRPRTGRSVEPLAAPDEPSGPAVTVSRPGRANEIFASSELRFRALVERSMDVIAVVDADINVLYVSPSIRSVLGYEPDEHLPLDLEQVVDGTTSYAGLIAGLVPGPGETSPLRVVRVRHRDGGHRWLAVRVTNLLEDPAVAGIVVNFRDITERKLAEEELLTERQALEHQLLHDALHDELTGLPNRNLLWNSLEGALHRAGRSKKPVAVLFCDLDQFKVINDSLGHTVGDVLLRSVAVRLEQSTRSGDTVGRFGGDEFVVVFDGVADETEASLLGERVLQIFEQPFVVDDTELFITASIGIAVGTAAADAENLLRDADAAMFRAKEKGRARLELFDRTLRLRAQERHDLEQALRRALERDEFRVLYQPVVALEEGAIVGAEALVRWQRPGRGLVGPEEFIGAAEESGLILPLGAWVLETACRQLSRWQSAMPTRRLTMAVNLSGRQLASPALVEEVARVLAATGCPPGAVTLELTETVLMGDIESSLATLDALKELGVQIAIDDFGTGYSSLAYLKRFPIDMLKIDKSFIDNLGADPYDSAIVAAITTMGTLLGQTIIAEGVETRRLARLVKDHNCELAQGFYFSEPVGPDRFLELLRSGTRYDLDLTAGRSHSTDLSRADVNDVT